jgi:flagellum-specific ATP synthase
MHRAETDPSRDASRTQADGYVWLSPALTRQNHYPTIDVLQSRNPLMPDVATPEHWPCAQRFRRLLANDQATRDLVTTEGETLSPRRRVEEVESGMDALWNYLCQPIGQAVDLETSVQQLNTLFTGTGSRG